MSHRSIRDRGCPVPVPHEAGVVGPDMNAGPSRVGHGRKVAPVQLQDPPELLPVGRQGRSIESYGRSEEGDIVRRLRHHAHLDALVGESTGGVHVGQWSMVVVRVISNLQVGPIGSESIRPDGVGECL